MFRVLVLFFSVISVVALVAGCIFSVQSAREGSSTRSAIEQKVNSHVDSLKIDSL